MILEAVYEPIFLDVSHGFRPKRSCHTALKQLKREFNGTRWFVEGDIKGCFDNINHAVLVSVMMSLQGAILLYQPSLYLPLFLSI